MSGFFPAHKMCGHSVIRMCENRLVRVRARGLAILTIPHGPRKLFLNRTLEPLFSGSTSVKQKDCFRISVMSQHIKTLNLFKATLPKNAIRRANEKSFSL